MSMRSLRLLESFLRTNFPQLGWTIALSDIGITTVTSQECLYLNATDITPSTNDSALFIRVLDSGASLPNGMRTQSHASGQFIAGSVQFEVLCESPANWTGAHAHFVFDTLQILRGIYGAPVHVAFSANNSVIALQGIAGAVADANVPTAFMTLAPAGRAYVGGV